MKRVCADDSVPFAHAKVGYRQANREKARRSKERRAFSFARAVGACVKDVRCSWLPIRTAIASVTLAMALIANAGERCLAIDGDTLVCNRQKVRLTNVYAAELDEPGGRAAKQRLRSVISSGDVTLRPLGTDRYGRILAEVYVDGRRIEQSDIGPRAGRGAQWSGERHLSAPLSHPRSAHRRRRRRLSNLVSPADAVLR